MPWVYTQQHRAFEGWVQLATNQAWNFVETSPFKGLILQPQHLKQQQVWIKTNIRLVEERSRFEEAHESEDAVEDVMQLELYNIEWHQGRIRWPQSQRHWKPSGGRSHPREPQQLQPQTFGVRTQLCSL